MNNKTRASYYGFLIAHYLFLLSSAGCAFKPISRHKNIIYAPANVISKSASNQQLNIFAPRFKPDNLKEVFIFIHGGSWNSGRKSQYNYLGSRMARKGVVAVIIDYPLSPQANYHQMAMASASAVKWVQANIPKYGGNAAKIFVAGHSAGGHLAALIAVRSAYFDTLGLKNPLKGAILIDAAGLDMYGYLQDEKLAANHTYLRTFTSDPAVWREASPLYHLHAQMPAFLIYRGEKTYSSIIKSNEKFAKALRTYDPALDYRVLKGKKHIPMIIQFLKSWNPLYHEIITFMQAAE